MICLLFIGFSEFRNQHIVDIIKGEKGYPPQKAVVVGRLRNYAEHQKSQKIFIFVACFPVSEGDKITENREGYAPEGPQDVPVLGKAESCKICKICCAVFS